MREKYHLGRFWNNRGVDKMIAKLTDRFPCAKFTIGDTVSPLNGETVLLFANFTQEEYAEYLLIYEKLQ